MAAMLPETNGMVPSAVHVHTVEDVDWDKSVSEEDFEDDDVEMNTGDDGDTKARSQPQDLAEARKAVDDCFQLLETLQSKPNCPEVPDNEAYFLQILQSRQEEETLKAEPNANKRYVFIRARHIEVQRIDEGNICAAEGAIPLRTAAYPTIA
jgi:hypothetical protein